RAPSMFLGSFTDSTPHDAQKRLRKQPLTRTYHLKKSVIAHTLTLLPSEGDHSPCTSPAPPPVPGSPPAPLPCSPRAACSPAPTTAPSNWPFGPGPPVSRRSYKYGTRRTRTSRSPSVTKGPARKWSPRC